MRNMMPTNTNMMPTNKKWIKRSLVNSELLPCPFLAFVSNVAFYIISNMGPSNAPGFRLGCSSCHCCCGIHVESQFVGHRESFRCEIGSNTMRTSRYDTVLVVALPPSISSHDANISLIVRSCTRLVAIDFFLISLQHKCLYFFFWTNIALFGRRIDF